MLYKKQPRYHVTAKFLSVLLGVVLANEFVSVDFAWKTNKRSPSS